MEVNSRHLTIFVCIAATIAGVRCFGVRRVSEAKTSNDCPSHHNTTHTGCVESSRGRLLKGVVVGGGCAVVVIVVICVVVCYLTSCRQRIATSCRNAGRTIRARSKSKNSDDVRTSKPSIWHATSRSHTGNTAAAGNDVAGDRTALPVNEHEPSTGIDNPAFEFDVHNNYM